MQYFWKETSRKTPGWIDLVVTPAVGGLKIIDDPVLDKEIYTITVEDIRGALDRAGESAGDAAELHEQLISGIIQHDPPQKQLYVCLESNIENDPGEDEVDMNFFTADSHGDARKKAQEAEYFNEEFSHYCIWPVKNLIKYLQDQLDKS